jgi:zinc transporter 2
MIVEVIGGVASGSLAILTDAAHMLSDVGGFLISMFSIWIGQKAHNQSNTFGYHRAEVIGALASILIIWTMVIWLAWEATDRLLFKHDFEIDAEYMMITAFVSLACNIFNLIALGHLPCMSHKGDNFMDAVTSVYKPHGGHSCSGHGHGHGHEHSHGEAGCSGHDHEHDHENPKKVHEAKKPHIQSMISDNSAVSDASPEDPSAKKLITGFGGLKVIEVAETDIETPEIHKNHHHHHKHHAEEENINIRAAVVHVIGDMLQSIGVIIASVLIYFWP